VGVHASRPPLMISDSQRLTRSQDTVRTVLSCFSHIILQHESPGLLLLWSVLALPIFPLRGRPLPHASAAQIRVNTVRAQFKKHHEHLLVGNSVITGFLG
jgi:hypothetical protein